MLHLKTNFPISTSKNLFLGGSIMESSIIIITLGLLLIMSAYFSATETAFSALNKIRIKNLASGGNERAKLVLKLSEDYDKILSTILIGNNIVNIASASLATTIFVNYFGDIGVTLSTIVMTILVLTFGEISPKSLAKEFPEKFAMFSAPILKFCVYLLIPINFFFIMWRKFLSLIIGPTKDTGITEEELLTIVEEAQHDGGIDEEDSKLIKSALEFNDLDVSNILIPRVDIVAISNKHTYKEIAIIFKCSGYSRLPVYSNSIDNIVGILHQKDFYNCLESEFEIEKLIKEPLIIIEKMKISSLLKLLQQTKSHLAIVIDEYGGTTGIVTLENVLEELVGEIWDEHDEVIQEFEPLQDGSYKVLGSARLEPILNFFNIEKETNNTTVSKWVIENLGKIPNEGDSFTYKNIKVVVTKTTFRRILEIIIEEIN